MNNTTYDLKMSQEYFVSNQIPNSQPFIKYFVPTFSDCKVAIYLVSYTYKRNKVKIF